MENLCVVCLSSDRRLYEISKSITELITAISPELDISKLCWECFAIVKRLIQFRKKAQHSKRILDIHLKEGLTASKKFQSETNLGISHIYTISLCDSNLFNIEETINTSDGANVTPMLPGNTGPKNNQDIEELSSKEESVIDCNNKCDDEIDLIVSESAIGFEVKKKKKVRSKKKVAVKKQYVCSDCKQTFDSRGKYEYHRQRHRGRVKCQDCGRDFSCRSALSAHAGVAHSDAPRDDGFRRYCQPCAKFFKTDCSYRKHMRTSARHVDPETLRHPCPVCGKRFVHPAVRDEHHKRVHMRRGRLQCTRCCRQYCSARALRSHITRRHTPAAANRDYICEVCGGGFKTAQVLKGHLRIHAKKLDVVEDTKNSEEDSIE